MTFDLSVSLSWSPATFQLLCTMLWLRNFMLPIHCESDVIGLYVYIIYMLRTSLWPTDLRPCVLLSISGLPLSVNLSGVLQLKGVYPDILPLSWLVHSSVWVHSGCVHLHTCVCLSPHLVLYIYSVSPMHPNVLNVCIVEWEGSETIQTHVEAGQF